MIKKQHDAERKHRALDAVRGLPMEVLRRFEDSAGRRPEPTQADLELCAKLGREAVEDFECDETISGASVRDGVPSTVREYKEVKQWLSTVSSLALTNAAKAEYERLCGWRERWSNLANDRQRARKRDRSQSQQEYIEARATRANRAIAALLREYWRRVSPPSTL
jgi:uncharacterized protein (DUF2235 family)